MHRFCFNEKITYWLRIQFPDHLVGLLSQFKAQQMRLIASYHGLYDEEEFQLRFEELKDLYLRASFPIERGGMGLRNIELVHQTAFISSMAASTRSLAKAFPSSVQLGAGCEVTQVIQAALPPQTGKLLK